MQVRHAVLRLHRWAGLAIGLVVVVVSLTGALIVIAWDLEARELEAVTRLDDAGNAGSAPVSPTALIEIARAGGGGRAVRRVEIPRDPRRASSVGLAGGLTLFIDPRSGAVIGRRSEAEEWSGRLIRWHQGLVAGTPGRVLVGASTVVFVLSLVLGVWLWWPSRRSLRRAFRIAFRRGFRRLAYDLHNVLGFYASPLLLVLGLTGVLLAYPSLRTFGAGVAGRLAPGGPVAARPGAASSREVLAFADPDEAVAWAWRRFEDAPWIRVVLPGREGGPYRVLAGVTTGDATRFHEIRIGGDGRLSRVVPAGRAPLAVRLDRSVGRLHTTEGTGPLYRALAVAACLVGGSLPVTGALVWWPRWKRRRRRRRRRRSRPAAQ